MKKLFIHIGSHKTGSTSIQNYMVKNREQLESRGLIYPTVGMQGTGHHKIAWACGHGRHERDRDLLDTVCNTLHTKMKNTGDVALISSEEFEYIHDIEPLQFLSREFEVKIIIYVRRQDEYLESSYNQHVRMFSIRYSGSIYQFSQRYNFFQRFNYKIIVDKWAQAFGKKNILIRPYGTMYINKDVRLDILSTIDRSLTSDLRVNETNNDNVSMAPAALPYLSHLNRLNLSESQHQKLISILSTSISNNSKHRLLHPEDAESFYEKFRPSNTLLFKEYTDYGVIPFDVKSEEDGNLCWVNHEQVDVRRLLDYLGQIL